MDKLIVSARSPTRVDLAGGTLDLWPIHQLLESKATVNVGIQLDAVAKVTIAGKKFRIVSLDQKLDREFSWSELARDRDAYYLLGHLIKSTWSEDLPGFHLQTMAKSPAGAGLGGSSCLAIACLSAICKAKEILRSAPPMSDAQLVALAQDIEANVIMAPTGVQDYWGGLRGRCNIISFPAGKVDVQTIEPPPDLSERMIICYSGQSRQSAINNWEIFKRVFDGDRALIATLDEIGHWAANCAEAVMNGKVKELISASKEEWNLRCKLWPNIATTRTQAIDLAAKQAGALFSRVCGAGGGGVMVAFADPNKRSIVEEAMTKAGGQILNAAICQKGTTLEVHR